MKSLLCRRPPRRMFEPILKRRCGAGVAPAKWFWDTLLRVVPWAIVVAVCTCELRAVPPRSSRKSPSAADFGDDVVTISDNNAAETEVAAPSRLAAVQGEHDDLAKRTLRALADAAGPNRRPRRNAPPRDVVKPSMSSLAAQEAADSGERRLDARSLEPAPLVEAPLTKEPPTDKLSEWVSAGQRANKARPAASKAATSKTTRASTARASVRWADARDGDSQVVRPAADWSGPATLMLRPAAGRFNPLRDAKRRDEDAAFKTRGINPLRAR
ncbi:MAG TPA: hypothetical protein VMV69_14445 [Pirellulales bacterium]|nr:hypothetical protein [Pirellulales bacterium]